MVLNYIWISFFIISFIVALGKLIFSENTIIMKEMVDSIFSTTQTSVMDIALPLIGMMAFWLGIMKIGEKAGVINFLSRMVSPFFSKLFPSIPKNHPSVGNMIMNFSANLLGLDNAATPLGLKAMDSLQTLNPKKEEATNAQIMFLVLHTSGLTLIPSTIMLYRYLYGASDPTDIFIPCIIATFCTTIIGIIIVGIKQKLNLFNFQIIGTVVGLAVFLFGLAYVMKHDSLKKKEVATTYIQQQITPKFTTLDSISQKDFLQVYPSDFQKTIKTQEENITPEFISKTNAEFINFKQGSLSRVISNLLLLLIPTLFILAGFRKKLNVFETFIEGAQDGFNVAIKIIPYLIAMLVSIALLRTSGVIDYVLDGVQYLLTKLHVNTDFIPALPTAIMKPLSGSGSRALMIETMQTYGADSFAGRLSSIFQGSADTTFYIIALYFGSVGIKKIRYALTAGLLTDLLGVICAIFVAYYFFS